MTQTATQASSAPLPAFLDAVEIGPPQRVRALTIWPLQQRTPIEPGKGLAYVPLAKAMADGLVQVEELSADGSVPNIRVQNHADVALLVLFGEEIIGAKQNRIANASFLVAPRADTIIDVSCVEAGRWEHSGSAGQSPSFSSADSLVSQSIRRRMQSHVRDSLGRGLGFHSDQSEVWSDVAQKLSDSGTRSRSGAYADYKRARAGQLRTVREALRPAPGQVGFVAAIDDEIVGVEAVGRPEVFNSYFERLVDAYAVDALDAERARSSKPVPDNDDADSSKRAAEFLDQLRDAEVDSARSIGLGEDLRMTSTNIEGSALVAGEVVHLTAAPALGAR